MTGHTSSTHILLKSSFIIILEYLI